MEHHLLAEHECIGDRVEVLEGPTGRRRWSDGIKARIVAESFVPGVRVAEVARRHGLAPQHLSTWRRLARNGGLTLPVDNEQIFAALALEDTTCAVSAEPIFSAPASPPQTSPPAIEIIASGVTVRLREDSPVIRIAEIASALRTLR